VQVDDEATAHEEIACFSTNAKPTISTPQLAAAVTPQHATCASADPAPQRLSALAAKYPTTDHKVAGAAGSLTPSPTPSPDSNHDISCSPPELIIPALSRDPVATRLEPQYGHQAESTLVLASTRTDGSHPEPRALYNSDAISQATPRLESIRGHPPLTASLQLPLQAPSQTQPNPAADDVETPSGFEYTSFGESISMRNVAAGMHGATGASTAAEIKAEAAIAARSGAPDLAPLAEEVSETPSQMGRDQVPSLDLGVVRKARNRRASKTPLPHHAHSDGLESVEGTTAEIGPVTPTDVPQGASHVALASSDVGSTPMTKAALQAHEEAFLAKQNPKKRPDDMEGGAAAARKIEQSAYEDASDSTALTAVMDPEPGRGGVPLRQGHGYPTLIPNSSGSVPSPVSEVLPRGAVLLGRDQFLDQVLSTRRTSAGVPGDFDAESQAFTAAPSHWDLESHATTMPSDTMSLMSEASNWTLAGPTASIRGSPALRRPNGAVNSHGAFRPVGRVYPRALGSAASASGMSAHSGSIAGSALGGTSTFGAVRTTRNLLPSLAENSQALSEGVTDRSMFNEHTTEWNLSPRTRADNTFSFRDDTSIMSSSARALLSYVCTVQATPLHWLQSAPHCKGDARVVPFVAVLVVLQPYAMPQPRRHMLAAVFQGGEFVKAFSLDLVMYAYLIHNTTRVYSL
jgi:hypothetical protein